MDIERNPDGSAHKLTMNPEGYAAYPRSSTHEWGMFAGLAVELGGYCDIELIDPSTGSQFWFQPANHRELALSDDGFPFVEILKQALDAAVAAGFFAKLEA